MAKQLALCIGNNDYQYSCLSKLNCAVNDAKAIAERLKTRGFDVIEYSDLNRNEMHEAIDDFEEKLTKYEVGLFYYAGHGFECSGYNLLMPVDTDGTDRAYRDWMALKLDTVINALEGKNKPNELKIKIIILDACRQDPDGRGIYQLGFAPIFAPVGTIIAFSTSPGQNAKERDGHGLYTQALLQSIDIPRIPIENMFKHVREKLAAETSGQQISWEHTSLMGNYFFNEDRIDSFVKYDSAAFKDGEYYFTGENEIGLIVSNLKSYNWHVQNPAISQINNLTFDEVSANDLFVLGRNIYQAAVGGAWKVRQFIDNFALASNIPLSVKIHILNGMAYEIYFNSNGQLRGNFKSEYYINILKLLEKENFQGSKNFIADQISTIKEAIIFIPGSEERIEMHLNCYSEEQYDEGLVFLIKSIYYHGRNILFDSDGLQVENFYWYQSHNQAALRSIIAERIVAPPDMLTLTFNVEVDTNSQFALPDSFCLRYKTVETLKS